MNDKKARVSRVKKQISPHLGKMAGMKNKVKSKEAGKSEKHRDAGRIGGLQTWLQFGNSYMQQVARRGGRPTRQEAAEKAWRTDILYREHAGRHGHQGGERQRGRHAAQRQEKEENRQDDPQFSSPNQIITQNGMGVEY